MEKLLEIINQIFNKTELLSCFWTELFCLFGVIINLFIFFFFNRRKNIKKISDILTFTIFSTNALFFLGIFIKNTYFSDVFNFTVLSNIFVFNNEYLLLKFFINLFFALFVLCTYKITKKAKFSTTLTNSCLLILSISSGLLMQVENAIFSFILLDSAAFFIYKFASYMRLRRFEIFSKDFVILSSLSTILFYSFYGLLFLVSGQVQSSIMQTIAAVALLLKAGLFPIYNYTLGENIKNNLPYSTLLFAFLPFLGVISFLKFSRNAFFSSEMYYTTISVFMVIVMICAGLFAFKSKNLIKYFANCTYLYCSLYILGALTTKNIEFAINSSFVLLFTMFSMYCFLYTLKRDFRTKKINSALLCGLSFKNPTFACLFSFGLLIITSCIPSILFLNNLESLKGIYEFDKYGSWICIAYLFANMLILLNALKIIKILYSSKENSAIFYTLKRTTRNIVVPVVIFVLLILGMLL